MGRSAEKDFQDPGTERPAQALRPPPERDSVSPSRADTQTCSAAGSRDTGVNICGSWSGVSAVRSYSQSTKP